jgi:hypothetical protein
MNPTLQIDTALDSSRLKSGLNTSKSDISSWSKSVNGFIISAFSVGAIAQFGKSTGEYFSNLGDAAEGLDISVEKFQALINVAKLAGKELGDVSKLLGDISAAQVEAIQKPDSAAGKSFSKMGITTQQLNQTSPEDLLTLIGKEMSGKSRTQVLDEGEGIVNKKTVATMIALAESMAKLDEVTQAQIANQQIASKSQIESIKNVGDTFDQLWNILKIQLLPIIDIAGKLLGTLADTIMTLFSQMINGLALIFTGFARHFSNDMETRYQNLLKTADRTQEDFTNRQANLWVKDPTPEAGNEPPNLVLASKLEHDADAGVTGFISTLQKMVKGLKDIPEANITRLKRRNDELDKSMDWEKENRFTAPTMNMSNFMGMDLGVATTAASLQQQSMRNIETYTKETGENTRLIAEWTKIKNPQSADSESGF